MTPDTYAQRLKDAREKAGLSLRQATKLLQLPHGKIEAWEAGITSPTPQWEIELAKAYGVGLEWLRTGEGHVPADVYHMVINSGMTTEDKQRMLQMFEMISSR